MPRSFPLAVLLLAVAAPVLAQHPHPSAARFSGFLFGDVTYVETERQMPDGFLMGQLVGHGNAYLSERLLFFGELSMTARETGYAVEVERAILRYDVADALKLSAGRYHTPISYWNVAFHHGLWLQTSVARPELIRMGGLMVPVHFIGAMAEGMVVTGPATFHYDAGFGNGRGAVLTRGGDAGDVNASRAAVATARVRPAALRALQLGGGVYIDRFTTAGTGPIDERTASAHVVYDRGAPELVAEYVNVRHTADAGDASTSEGWYLHGAVRLPGALARFKPYARLERIDVGPGLVLGPALADYRALVGGVRFDFETLAALKAELRSESFARDDRQASLYLQASFVIPSFTF